MHIGIAGPVTISDYVNYLNRKSKIQATNFTGLKAPSIDSYIHGLLKTGNKVSIYTLTPEVSEPLRLKGDSLEIFVSKYRSNSWERALDYFKFESREIEKLIEMEPELPDIIHANWTYEFASGVSGFRSILPIVITIHDWAPRILKLHPNYYRLSRYLLDIKTFKTDRLHFIANSPYIAAKVKNRWEKIIPIVPNAISDTYLDKKIKNEKTDNFIILSVSNSVGKGKNIEKLLYAFQLFRKRVPNSSLKLAGIPFTLSNPKMQKWKSRHLLDNVNLLGPLDHNKLIEEYDKASVLVHPSLEESFGLVLIEAMARKLPIIGGKNSGAVPNVLDNGNAGLLCNVSSAQALLEAIIKIYEDENLRDVLIENGYTLVQSRYTPSAIVDQTIKIYESLILKHNESITYIK